MRGVADTKEKNLSDEIASLNNSLNGLAEQSKEAGKLNLQLSQTINDRKRADQQSTQVFTNALNATAHLRFDCRFDDNIMQQLDQAADRADQAASSGFASPLRTGDPPVQ
ncbi:hypothetical protein [Cellvibrio mixtus]|nr:hypothetical protein [Cellvibrio mixtus]